MSLAERATPRTWKPRIVQLLADVPWVYNEMGAKTGSKTTTAISITSETRYVGGLVRGAEASVPLEVGQQNPASRGVTTLRSCLVRQVEPTPRHVTRPKKYLPYGFRPRLQRHSHPFPAPDSRAVRQAGWVGRGGQRFAPRELPAPRRVAGAGTYDVGGSHARDLMP